MPIDTGDLLKMSYDSIQKNSLGASMERGADLGIKLANAKMEGEKLALLRDQKQAEAVAKIHERMMKTLEIASNPKTSPKLKPMLFEGLGRLDGMLEKHGEGRMFPGINEEFIKKLGGSEEVTKVLLSAVNDSIHLKNTGGEPVTLSQRLAYTADRLSGVVDDPLALATEALAPDVASAKLAAQAANQSTIIDKKAQIDFEKQATAESLKRIGEIKKNFLERGKILTEEERKTYGSFLNSVTPADLGLDPQKQALLDQITTKVAGNHWKLADELMAMMGSKGAPKQYTKDLDWTNEASVEKAHAALADWVSRQPKGTPKDPDDFAFKLQGRANQIETKFKNQMDSIAKMKEFEGAYNDWVRNPSEGNLTALMGIGKEVYRLTDPGRMTDNDFKNLIGNLPFDQRMVAEWDRLFNAGKVPEKVVHESMKLFKGLAPRIEQRVAGSMSPILNLARKKGIDPENVFSTDAMDFLNRYGYMNKTPAPQPNGLSIKDASQRFMTNPKITNTDPKKGPVLTPEQKQKALQNFLNNLRQQRMLKE